MGPDSRVDKHRRCRAGQAKEAEQQFSSSAIWQVNKLQVDKKTCGSSCDVGNSSSGLRYDSKHAVALNALLVCLFVAAACKWRHNTASWTGGKTACRIVYQGLPT